MNPRIDPLVNSAAMPLAQPDFGVASEFGKKGPLHVAAEIHAPVQDAGDQDRLVGDAINDDVPPSREDPVRGRQFRVAVADLRIFPDGQKRLVENGTIGEGLRLAPGFQGVLEDISKIVLRSWGKNQGQVRA